MWATRLEFIARSSLQAVGSEEVRNAIVTEVENPAEEDYDLENRKNIVLTFDRDLPDEILNSGDPTGYVVENITYTPDVEIRNNVFSQSSCRGLLWYHPRGCADRRQPVPEHRYVDDFYFGRCKRLV